MRAVMLFFALFLSLQAQANSLEERMYFLTQQAELFSQICFDTDGTFKQGVTHFNDSTSIRETAIDCDGQLMALNSEIAAINDQVAALPASCEFVARNINVEELAEQGLAATDAAASCPGVGNLASCTSTLMCNFATSLVPLTSVLNVCPREQPNCFQQLLRGFGYSFYDLGCSITSLFGRPCESDEAPPADEEGASSDAALMAQFQTPPKVTRFTENPMQWMREALGGFFDQLGDTILERYGCAEWENPSQPFMSPCKTPMSWSCADCGIRANMVCGVIGYITGLVGQEILTGFVIGAAAGIASRAAVMINARAARYFPLSARLGTSAFGLGARAVGRVSRVWEDLKSTPLIQGIGDLSARLASFSAAANRQARRVIVISASQDAVLAAIRGFNDLTEQALMAGYRSTAAVRAQTIARLEEGNDRVSDILDGNITREDGTRFESVDDYVAYKNENLTPEERGQIVHSVTTGDGAEARVVISRRRDVEYDSTLRIDLAEPAPVAQVAPVPVAPLAVADDIPRDPEIIVTGQVDYQVPRAEIPVIVTQLRERGIDLDNLTLPLDATVVNQLNRNQRTIVLEEVIGRRLPSDLADDILDEVRLGASATDPTNFRYRRQRVIAALEEMGLTAEEAALKADELFASRLLGDVPPSQAASAVTPPRPAAAAGGAPSPVGERAVLPSEVARAAPGRAFDFAQRESLERQLSLVVGSNPGLRGRGIDDIISEIQRGTRTTDLNPAEAGIDRFFARYNVPASERGPIIREWDRLVERRRQLTVQNVETDLQRLGTRVDQRSVRCDQVNRLHPDAFLPAAGCREIRFNQRVNGEYCTCNLTDTTSLNTRAPGPWLLPCAQLGSQYNISRGQSDVSALPVKARALNRCWKVDIEPGVTCYHGGLGPTFTGFGGEAQMNCSNSRITRDLGDTTEPWGNSTGTWSVSRYAPISDDARMISITDAGRRCLDAAARRNGGTVCTGAGLQTIRQEVEALKRSGPNGRLTAEDINEAEMYVEYLEGRIQMDQFGNLRCLGSSELATGPCR